MGHLMFLNGIELLACLYGGILGIGMGGMCIRGWVARWRSPRWSAVCNCYRELLFGYLSPRERLAPLEFPGLHHPRHQRILIDQLRLLTRALSDIEERLLLLIFRTNELYDYVYRRINRGSVPAKAAWLSVFSEIIPRRTTILLYGHFIQSPHRELRYGVLAAYLNYRPDRIVSTLRAYHHELSGWDQVGIFRLMVRRSLNEEDYGVLLRSKQNSIVIYGLSVIGYFGLRELEPEVRSLIGHPSDEVRIAVYQILSELGASHLDVLFEELFPTLLWESKCRMVRESVQRQLFPLDFYARFVGHGFPPRVQEMILRTCYNLDGTFRAEIMRAAHMGGATKWTDWCKIVTQKSV